MAVTLTIAIEPIPDSVDIAKNQSKVKVTVRTKSTYGSYNNSDQPGSVTVDGTKTNFSHSFSKNTTTTIYSKTHIIQHGNDGKKTLKVSASYNTGVSSGTISTSASKVLKTIPRVSVPTVSSGTRYLGKKTTIYTNRKSNSFTHKLTWAWGGKSGTIDPSVGDSYDWTPSLDTFSAYIPTKMSDTCKITCETFSGSTSIGSKTVSFTLAIPSYTVPTAGTVSYSGGDRYLQNISTVKFTPTNANINGASITYTVKMDGASKTVTGTNTASLGVAKYSGERKMTIYAKDTRGNEDNSVKTVTINPYTKPVISSISFDRYSDASGTMKNDEGNYLKIAYIGNVYNAYSNTIKSFTMSVKDTSNTEILMSAPSSSLGAFSGSIISTSAIDDCPNKKFTLSISLTDNYATYTKTVTIPTATPIMDFSKNGHEISFFGVADPDATEDKLTTYGKIVSQYTPGNTMEDDIHFHAKSGTPSVNTGFRSTRTDTGVSMFTGIGAGGNNHGVYSEVSGSWMIYVGNDGNTYLSGGDGKRIYTRNQFGFYDTETTNPDAASIITRWADGVYHDLISRSSGGLEAYFGPASINKNTVTYLRGQTVRIYAHGGGVYLGTSGTTAVTSDRNLKKDIFELGDKYSQFFNKLRPVSYKYTDNGHRDHIGYIAQEVEDALMSSGLTTEQFAGICIEKDITLNPNEDASLTDEERKTNEVHYDELYSLRYEEFIALNTFMIQKANKIIESQQKEIDDLNKRLDKLEKLVGGAIDDSVGNY